jgi:hypothetical protein
MTGNELRLISDFGHTTHIKKQSYNVNVSRTSEHTASGTSVE